MNEDNITQINHLACKLQEEALASNDMLYPEALADVCQRLAAKMVEDAEIDFR
jgi:hypothetical protein